MKQLLLGSAMAFGLGLLIQPCCGQDTQPQESERSQPSDPRQRFDRMNRGGRGKMNSQKMIQTMFQNDKNSDGKLSRDEVNGRLLQFFERVDANKDGYLTPEEVQARMSGGRGGQGRGGQGRGRNETSGLEVGQKAPDFKLKSLDGKSQTELSVIRAEKPVVLFFGSYT